MSTDRFNRCFSELLAAARRYHDAPRSPERVVALAAARWNLEIARRAVADERHHRLSASARRPVRRPVDDEADRARLRVQALGLTSN